MMMASSSPSPSPRNKSTLTTTINSIFNQSTAWFFVWFLAVWYYVSTRLSQSPSIGLFQSGTSYGRTTIIVEGGGVEGGQSSSSSSSSSSSGVVQLRLEALMSSVTTTTTTTASSSSSSTEVSDDVDDDVDAKRSIIRDFFGGKYSTIDLVRLVEDIDEEDNNKNKTEVVVQATIRYPIRLVQDDFVDSIITSTTWREDDELGRGYLLLSTTSSSSSSSSTNPSTSLSNSNSRHAGRHNGKIYRWETGGGPIAIGKTLHLSDSGCRSGLYRPCHSSGGGGNGGGDDRSVKNNGGSDSDSASIGSGGIVIDYGSSSTTEPPRLIVAEYGEGRIVRLEENGARTPLVIGVSHSSPPSSTTTTKTANTSLTASAEDDGNKYDNNGRLVEPFKLMMTPYGDLMILDRRSSGSSNSGSSSTMMNNNDVLWKLPKISSIPPLPSLAVSREAHAWERIDQQQQGNSSSHKAKVPDVFFDGMKLGGMVLDTTGQRVLVTTSTQQSDSSSSSVVMVFSIPLLDDIEEDLDGDEDNDDEDEDETKTSRAQQIQDGDVDVDVDEGTTTTTEIERRLQSRKGSVVVFDYSKYAQVSGAGPIEIDNNGNLYLAVDDGIMIVSSPSPTTTTTAHQQQNHQQQTEKKFMVAIVPFNHVNNANNNNKIVDLTLGSDRFLYISTPTQLFRMKVRQKPLVIDKERLMKA